MGRHANPDIRRAFVEFEDETTPSKCNKVRCIHCGFVRAKNTTRQLEHLQQCQLYLSSPDAIVAMNNVGAPASTPGQPQPAASLPPSASASSSSARLSNIYTGQQPNPNLQIRRRGPNKRRRDGSVVQHGSHSMPPPPLPPNPAAAKPTPSLTNHLLTRDPTAFTRATQQPFLSQAGCGTLSATSLTQWLSQDSHMARGYISFVGALIAKTRLPYPLSTSRRTGIQFHVLYRTLDLLISALNNVRREMSFFEVTATKYRLVVQEEPPNAVTKGYLDLFVASGAPGASLLEGLVVLWATQHCYRTSWHHANTFTSSLSTPFTMPGGPSRNFPCSTSLSSSYLSQHNPYAPHSSDSSHILALHHSMIPNWTSPAFARFVDACKIAVDELANAQTSGNGRDEMARCEGAWRQVLWLWERSWPEVDGVGEDDAGAADSHGGRAHGTHDGEANARAGSEDSSDSQGDDDENDSLSAGADNL
ncbi:hypothetical protein LTR50_006995 [Elasticomyces elasticus]|nr:hypothetical protein LTR50_006995 [Elasticomyces elasticus]